MSIVQTALISLIVGMVLGMTVGFWSGYAHGLKSRDSTEKSGDDRE